MAETVHTWPTGLEPPVHCFTVYWHPLKSVFPGYDAKTMVLASHSLDIIGTLCTKALYLDQGAQVFLGEPREAIARYRAASKASPSGPLARREKV